MPILRKEHQRDFTQVPNSILRDERLDLKERGLMCCLLALPDNWDFSFAGLSAALHVGASSLRTGLRTLKACGYLTIEQTHGEGGTFVSVWTIHEEPVADDRDLDADTREPTTDDRIPITDRRFPIGGDRYTVSDDNKYINQNVDKYVDKNVDKDLDVGEERQKQQPKRESLRDILEQDEDISQNPELREAWEGFIEMRKKGGVFTAKALKLNISTARKLSRGDPDRMTALVNQSVERGWKGIYDLKDGGGGQAYSHPQKKRQGTGNPFLDLLEQEGGEA